MNPTIQFFLFLSLMNNSMLFDFSTDANIDQWRVVNDGVMGGLSQSQFSVNDEGHGYFSGKVSLENNGGFSSVRYGFKTQEVSAYSKIEIRLKGDGKAYQFRVKADRRLRYSYIAVIDTSGEWETITVTFDKMYPAFRGRLLDLPNYEGQELSEIAFLIGNKKEEDFTLQIDYLKLQ